MRPGEPLILWDWTFSHLPDIGHRVEEHLILTGIAVGLGFVIAFVLSLAIRELPLLYSPVTWVAGVLYSVPSLALFSLLIPFTGLSIVTAEIGLVTVTGVIGQGGLGALILQGIQQFFATPLVIGALLSIALAVVLDGVLVLIQRRVTPWTRPA